ncbi:MAG: cyanophycin synthetase, partial [Microbacterium sp.]
GDVAVFTPIDIDHVKHLGSTIAEIATVKSGIIKEGAAVVSARQTPEAEAIIRAVAEEKGASTGPSTGSGQAAATGGVAIEGTDFEVTEDRLAVGGQLLSVQGLAGVYTEQYLPLHGSHQAQNAAVAIAAVESLIGAGSRAIPDGVLAQGLQEATSPGRLQLVGSEPTVIVDAAHNPHGARALARALDEVFAFDEWGLVLGVLGDKDVAGVVAALAPHVAHVFATSVDSDRAGDPETLADIVEATGRTVSVHPDLEDAASAARNWALEGESRAVVIAGSVVLAGEAVVLAEEDGWKA